MYENKEWDSKEIKRTCAKVQKQGKLGSSQKKTEK
jgi:hypothetical protein